MQAAQHLRVFPLSAGAAAADTPLPVGPVGLTDLTAQPRFGVKGPGAAAWLAAQRVSLPAINRIGRHGSLLVLRLGNEDIVILAEGARDELNALTAAWNAESGPRGYSSWREEGWAWMRLSGPGVQDAMAALCAVDLRAGHFGADEIAQTRVAHVEAVTFRSDDGFDVLFDISVSAFFIRAVAAAARQLAAADLRDKEQE